tara:strand:- start:2107 stop:2286 length:180 start_codon:yes stop_codon:yes gene_type:complete
MAEKKIGVTRKGEVIKDQGFVPYNAPENVSTPSVAKGSIVRGKNKGMGAALRGGKYICA